MSDCEPNKRLNGVCSNVMDIEKLLSCRMSKCCVFTFNDSQETAILSNVQMLIFKGYQRTLTLANAVCVQIVSLSLTLLTFRFVNEMLAA